MKSTRICGENVKALSSEVEAIGKHVDIFIEKKLGQTNVMRPSHIMKGTGSTVAIEVLEEPCEVITYPYE